MLDSRPNPNFVPLVAHIRLQLIKVCDFRNLLGFRHLRALMSGFTYPVPDGCVLNACGALDAAPPRAIQVHLEAQLSHIVSLAPRSVGCQKLTTAVLTLVRLSLFTTTVLDRFGGVAVWTLHISILPLSSLLFQQRLNFVPSLSAATLSHQPKLAYR